MDFDDSIMDDLEDDEELLAELQALKGGEAEDIAGKSKSADAETAKGVLNVIISIKTPSKN